MCHFWEYGDRVDAQLPCVKEIKTARTLHKSCRNQRLVEIEHMLIAKKSICSWIASLLNQNSRRDLVTDGQDSTRAA